MTRIDVLPEDRGSEAFLADEYAARLEASLFDYCAPMRVDRYLYELAHDSGDPMTAAEAHSIAVELHAAGRGPACAETDFGAANPSGLGRVEQP